MRKSTDPLTPDRAYRYAVLVCQPHLMLRDAKKVAAQTILTVLFAAARISSISDTCRLLRDVPDEYVVAAALYATLPEYDILHRRVQKGGIAPMPRIMRLFRAVSWPNPAGSASQEASSIASKTDAPASKPHSVESRAGPQ